MGREVRIGLVLTAAACLVAVLVDWAVQELNSDAAQTGLETPQAHAAGPGVGEADQVSAEAGQEHAGQAQDATAGSPDQG